MIEIGLSIMSRDDDLNVIGLLREVWAAKVFLLVGLCVGVLAGACFSVLAVPKFEARMMIGPAQPLDASMRAQFRDGQNSYVMGLSERSQVPEGISNFTRFEAMMRGGRVAALLLRDERIVDGVQADRSFVFEGLRDGLQANVLSDYIARSITIDPFGETALRALVYRHADVEFAAYFVQKVHRVTDQLIRAEMRSDVDQRIGYLERVIAKTNNPEQRRIVTNLLLEQERARMMVSMDAPVAASVIEPVVTSVKTVWPNAAFVYSGFGLAGLLVGYFVFGIVHYQARSAAGSVPVRRGEDLRHVPQREKGRPLKYGSWFSGDSDNDLDDAPVKARRAKDRGDAAE